MRALFFSALNLFSAHRAGRRQTRIGWLAATFCAIALHGNTQLIAGVTSIDAYYVAKPAGILPTFTTNDIKIDFTGYVRGQQLILTLTQGSVFQRTIVGSNLPPDADAFADFPDAPYDTFLAMGESTSQNSPDIIVVGGAVDVFPGSTLQFNTAGLNVAWAPGTGVDIADRNDFLTARITLSNDALGTLRYFGSTSAGTGDPLRKDFSVCNGIISLHCGGGPPVVADYIAQPRENEVVTTTMSALAESWSELLDFTYTPGFGAPSNAPGLNLAPNWDPTTQDFSWDTTGSTRGTYTWAVEATNGFGTGRGLIQVVITVPEPASGLLLVLGSAAALGMSRRRGK